MIAAIAKGPGSPHKNVITLPILIYQIELIYYSKFLPSSCFNDESINVFAFDIY